MTADIEQLVDDAVRSHRQNQERLSPPQKSASDGVALRLLSAVDLARHWLAVRDSPELTKAVLDEFTRRYWVEQEERAEHGDVLRIYPPWRILPSPARARTDHGLDSMSAMQDVSEGPRWHTD